MRRALAFLLALFVGAIAGYGGSRTQPREDTVAAENFSPAEAAADSAASARPVSPAPHAAAVTAKRPPPERPRDTPDREALRERALAGDVAAAAQWVETDEACRYVQQFGARPLFDADEPPDVRFTQFAQITAAEQAQLDDAAVPAGQRAALALRLEARLLERCAGYVPGSAADRYAIAQVAARDAASPAFWRFVKEPPFAHDALMRSGGDAEQLARIRDWTQRVPAQLQERAGRGDAEAALALGLAYALSYDDAIADDLPTYPLLNSALDNDAAQSYRWLGRYLQQQPAGAQAERVRQWRQQLAAMLDATQRADAQRWLQQFGPPPPS